MKYLAIKLTKNPLFKIMCVKCWEEIINWARICTDNKTKTPSACFCDKCLQHWLRDLVVKHFNDWMADIKNLM